MEKLNNDTRHEVTQQSQEQNAREHLANERTLLAWIRTSIGIMAFGFVVVKFSLFIKQISLLLGKNGTVAPPHGYSAIIGISLVALGTITLLMSYFKYKQTENQLNNQAFKSSSILVLALTIIILIISIMLILYLVESTRI